jgi:tetratricopeptide (TPR) repeat protein
MSSLSRRVGPLAALVFVGLAGCAHGLTPKPVPLSAASQALTDEAVAVAPVTNEEDYIEARLLYQALPASSPEQPRLRAKLLDYLLGPIATLDAERLRKNPALLGNEDDFERLADSFHDALETFAPEEMWTPGGPRVSPGERTLLVASAKLLVAAHSPRGNELPVAMGLFVLQALDGNTPDWAARLSQLFSWLDAGAQLAAGAQGPRHLSSPNDILESVAAVWPSPPVLDQLSSLVFARQERVAGILRRPLGSGEGARGLLSELLIDTESLSNLAVAAASFYVRCGQFARASAIAGRLAEKPGDDPEFRQLVAAAAAPGAKAADYLALARRFLPRGDLFHGTSTDRLDPATALGVLRQGLGVYPTDTELLLAAARVARLVAAPLLSLRYLDEGTAALVAQKANADTIAELTAERMELAFLRLKMHIDPDRMAAAEREAESLRRQFGEARRRFGGGRIKLDDNDIDSALASGLVDAGQIDKATPLLERASRATEPSVEVTRQQANLALKRGQPQQAINLLRNALSVRERNAPAEDTLPYVEGQARLSFLLGNAHDVTAHPDDARKAWAAAARGWERLMLEQIRRKNLSSSAEATFEVGRLYYLLGRRDEGVRKFDEAIAQDEDRDQSYLDAIAFLVQRGESDAALDIFRRALARPGRGISEYVKVYASLWIVDLTQRSANAADPGALAYLRGIAGRKVALRPPRAAAWYTELARYATGQLDYAGLLAKADTPGKRAEAYFYEAMRRLSQGQSEAAHALWSKVMETKMLSFFEFEMASRYLRTGAPARPETADKSPTI